jgi:dephospho-CoA kinase
MIVVGLTGSLGSGKTTVARMFGEMGARVVDSDRLAREAVEPGKPAYTDIIREFGEGILRPDGRIDRAALGRIVFADPARRKVLESIVHPRVEEARRELMSGFENNALVILDVPLLFESGLDRECGKTVVVAVDDEARLARLKAAGLDEEDVRRRLASQMPQEDKKARADYVIDNSAGLDRTRDRVREIMNDLQSKA